MNTDKDIQKKKLKLGFGASEETVENGTLEGKDAVKKKSEQ